jgi:hypothetical protein
VRCPGEILASPGLTAVIDTGKPFCVILAIVLDYVEPGQAAQIVAAFREAMPAGSFLILSIGMNNDTPELAEDVIRAYRAAAQVYLHSREQVAGYFAGLELVNPGLTEARHWRQPLPMADETPRPADLMVGVGRKAP